MYLLNLLKPLEIDVSMAIDCFTQVFEHKLGSPATAIDVGVRQQFLKYVSRMFY